MAIVLEAITHVWFAGRMIPPGQVFSADDAFGKKLIQGGSAKVREAAAQEASVSPDEEERVKLEGLTVPLLKALAKKNDVNLSADDKKDDIVEKLIESGVKFDEDI
ncbi:hypothetical protein [Sporosarcina sp. FSL K6-1508]|uniref:hypothetical protein n=1 Tax=Sporosarcina sp. FSL K6-1508 TaxID=2921553 RepID=UPI0030F7F0C5